MARQRRPFDQTTWFHVTNRGADRQDIFSGPADHRLFEELVVEASELHRVEIHAFAFMMNHFHLLLRVLPGGDVAAMMQRATSRYAAAYNTSAGRTGPLVGDRYTAVPIMSSEQLQYTGRYVHRNPLAMMAVESLASYRFSSFACYVERRPTPDWLHTDRLLAPYRGDRGAYRRYVERTMSTDRQPFGDLPPLAPVSLDELDEAVAATADVVIATFRSPTSGVRNDARRVAVMLAIDLRCAPVDEITEHYGMTDPNSTRRLARRARVEASRTQHVAALRDRVLARLGRNDGRSGVGRAS